LSGSSPIFSGLSKGKILSFGELLIRFCPDVAGSWIKDSALKFNIGGAEANVASALALWQLPVRYFTAIPDNLLSRHLLTYLSDKGVDTSKVMLEGERLGIFYLPVGGEMKDSGVIYDRKDSSFAKLKAGSINWDDVFEDVTMLHFSAICPALSADAAAVCTEAIEVATRKNIFISLDLNYRAKLWQYGKDPLEIMPGLATGCDLVMGNIWAANKMLGLKLDDELLMSAQKQDYIEHAQITSKELIKTFPRVKAVANTFRFNEGAAGINYFTTLYAENELLQSPDYSTERIVDKVGSGDCFMAGLLYGFFKELSLSQTLNFATAAAFQKLFIPGDITNQTVDEINKAKLNYG
jgi:2-dehydro-3-deoxygluconokinase